MNLNLDLTPCNRVNLKLVLGLFLLFIFSIQPVVLAAEHDQQSQQHQPDEHDSHDGDDDNDHEKHEQHDGGDDKDHEEPELNLTPAQLQEFGIKLLQAKPGVINKTQALTGEVIVAPERLYHVVPRVSGVVLNVYKHLGDQVEAGDLLATLSSRDLADAKAQLVAADSLLQLANANLKRERDLYNSKVTAKREYLAAKQAQAEMFIKRKAARQRLLAIGLTEKAIGSLLRNTDKNLTLYELRAPAKGVIIEKHVALGEVLATDLRSFTIADLAQVWVNLTVYQKDLPSIHQGQQVSIRTRFSLADQQASVISSISWISPILDEKTRSAKARVIIDNPDGHWRPGLFVSAKVATEQKPAEIVIPLSALQTIKGKTTVFVQHEVGDFEPQAVQTGRRDFQQVEITQGLKPGQTYVSENAFTLKAQLQKGEFGEGHSH